MCDIAERFANNEGVTLHFLDANKNTSGHLTPLLHIPGAFGAAETFINDMKQLSPRRCISVSLRGRGKSSVPEHGYRLNDLTSDLEAIVKETNLNHFYLYAFSFAVPTALRFTVRHPDKVKGLIIGDYPARYPKLPLSWTEKFLDHPDLVNAKAVLATQDESEEVLLWDELKSIQCPVLILTGEDKSAQPQPVLSAQDIEEYRKQLSNVSFYVFKDTGHRLWEPDHEIYIRTIKEFMETGTRYALSE